MANLGTLEPATALLVGGASDEQIAACAELTQFASDFDEQISHKNSTTADRIDESSKMSSEPVGNDAAEKGYGGKKKRERGTPWTEEEHKLFLQGLDRFGKGDWRSISRQCVFTRTPAQVASHAQKYFIRQEGGSEKPGRRVSIHDISSVEQTMPARNQRRRRKRDRDAAGAETAAFVAAIVKTDSAHATRSTTDDAILFAARARADVLGGGGAVAAPTSTALDVAAIGRSDAATIPASVDASCTTADISAVAALSTTGARSRSTSHAPVAAEEMLPRTCANQITLDNLPAAEVPSQSSMKTSGLSWAPISAIRPGSRNDHRAR